jgi:hypothetical protein
MGLISVVKPPSCGTTHVSAVAQADMKMQLKSEETEMLLGTKTSLSAMIEH